MRFSKKKKIALVHLILVFIATGNAGADPGYEQTRGFCVEALSSITAGSFRDHLYFLGSDLLQGRAPGTKGGDIAARYIASELEKLDVKPFGGGISYFQPIQMHGSIALPASELFLFSDSLEKKLELFKDYLLFKSGAQTLVPNPVELVFVGYGIVAPEFDYNDYQSLDIRDKIAVILPGEPFSTDPDFFDASNPTIYSYPESKQRIAVSMGARGSILIADPDDEFGRDWDFWIKEFTFEDVTLAYSPAGHLSLLMNPASAQQLFDRAPIDLARIFAEEDKATIPGFVLKKSISFKGVFKERDFIDRNVIGYIEGNHPQLKKTTLILSAHYDHLGIGPTVDRDSIYNGVFDNASGVSALLEIAKAFKSCKKRPERSVLFLFLIGEEKGLLGSTFYLDHPVVPLYKTIADINIDGIAMFDTFNDVVGIGAQYSTLGTFLNQAAEELGLYVSELPPIFLHTETFARSDQITFARAGIPSILVMEGMDYKNRSSVEGMEMWIRWQNEIYHTPFDDLNQPMNLQAAIQHCRLLYCYASLLADSPIEPQWYPGTRYINARLQSIAEGR